MPSTLPPNCKFLVSIGGVTKTQSQKKQGVVSMLLEKCEANGQQIACIAPRPLSKEARKQICVQTLANAGKTLDHEEMDRFLFGEGLQTTATVKAAAAAASPAKTNLSEEKGTSTTASTNGANGKTARANTLPSRRRLSGIRPVKQHPRCNCLHPFNMVYLFMLTCAQSRLNRSRAAAVTRVSSGSAAALHADRAAELVADRTVHNEPEHAAAEPGVFVVRNAGLDMVNGRYLRKPESDVNTTDKRDKGQPGCCIYSCEADDSFRLVRIAGGWCLQHTATLCGMYMCNRGTDTPPTSGWFATAFGKEPVKN